LTKSGAKNTRAVSIAPTLADSVNELTVLEEKNNSVYCPVIYQGMYVERRDSETSLIAPCCAAKGQQFPNQKIDFYTNSFLQRLRQENSAGIASKECQVCWDQEQYTSKSLRTSAIEFYSNFPEDRKSLLNLDWNVEPICNAKCIICSSYHSSAWLAEDQKFGGKDYPIYRTASSARSNDVIDQLDLSTVQRVYFNGGEPVLSQDPVKILTKLQQQQRLDQVLVGFNMNGSKMPSDQMIALLKQAKHVTVYFSIDGIEEKFEYIRNPLSWQELQITVKKMLDLGVDNACMSTTLGIHNLQIAQEIEDWWKDFTSSYASDINIFNTYQLVTGSLSISNASTALKQQLLTELDPAQSAEQFGIKCLSTAQGSDAWLPWLEQLDQRRGLDWRGVLPRLHRSALAAGVVK
jgi:hypothetical protein